MSIMNNNRLRGVLSHRLFIILLLLLQLAFFAIWCSAAANLPG